MSLQTHRNHRSSGGRLAPFLLAFVVLTFAACKQQTATQPSTTPPEVPTAATTPETAKATPTAMAPAPAPKATEAAATKKGDAPAKANIVDVAEKEFVLAMPTTLPAGPTEFKVKNNGTFEHSLEIKGQGIDQKLAANLKPGESGTLTVDLKPGTYEVFCPVGNHASRGMKLELTVKAP